MANAKTTKAAPAANKASRRTIWKDESGVSLFMRGSIYHAPTEAVAETGKSLKAVEVSDLKAAGLSLIKAERIGTYRFIALDADAESWDA